MINFKDKLQKLKSLLKRKRLQDLYQLIIDFIKKCNDDHVTAFGAMSAFFFLLSLLPFMLFLLTLTKYLPFTKDDILVVLQKVVTFERSSMIFSMINEVYHKTSASVFTVSILAALWSSSKGMYSIVKGLNSVYDIDDNRNYFVLRIFSMFYTLIFTVIIIIVMIVWVFGQSLYTYIKIHFPFLQPIASIIIQRGTVLSTVSLIFTFMWIYKFVSGRKRNFLHQFPGALVATLGWSIVSWLCSMYMNNFSNFTYIYGSMAGIMILLIWMYFCMSMIFYGAEVNFFLENKENYHALIQIIRPSFRRKRKLREEMMRKEEEEKHHKKKNH
ncbi:MAG: YihY/virulence factor BrkB family protein [Eubacteriales bacterium]|nr:YihY/virulence factor BrkB family protein [Eubacteriales bacterium]